MGADPQPLEPGAQRRRLLGRRGRGGGRRHRPGRPRHRRRRFDPHSGVLLRSVRPQTQPLPHAQRSWPFRELVRRQCRPRGVAQRARLGAAAGRRPGPRTGQPILAAGAGAPLRRRGRPRSGQAARGAARPVADRPGPRCRYPPGARRHGQAAAVPRPRDRADPAAGAAAAGVRRPWRGHRHGPADQHPRPRATARPQRRC
ncbi:hypothetical protein D3C75_802490 [compost metagenome]